MALPKRLESFRATLRARCDETGARLHRLLADHELADYEARHGVTLPESYRAVLSGVGNGWESDDSFELLGLSPLTENPNLSQPYPYPSAHLIQQSSGTWLLQENGGQARTVSGVGDVVKNAPGLLCLSEDESGQSWFLVVSGTARGTVWLFDAQSQSFGHVFGVVDFIERMVDPQTILREAETYPLQDSDWKSPKPVFKRHLVTGFFEVYSMNALDGRPLKAVLGEPIANQVLSKTGASQAFERGTLTWVSGQGITALDAQGNVVFKNF